MYKNSLQHFTTLCRTLQHFTKLYNTLQNLPKLLQQQKQCTTKTFHYSTQPFYTTFTNLYICLRNMTKLYKQKRQLYSNIHNFTNFTNTLQQKCETIYKRLHNNCTQLYITLQCFTHILHNFTTLHNFTHLYTTLQNFLQNFTKFDTTLQNFYKS